MKNKTVVGVVAFLSILTYPLLVNAMVCELDVNGTDCNCPQCCTSSGKCVFIPPTLDFDDKMSPPECVTEKNHQDCADGDVFITSVRPEDTITAAGNRGSSDDDGDEITYSLPATYMDDDAFPYVDGTPTNLYTPLPEDPNGKDRRVQLLPSFGPYKVVTRKIKVYTTAVENDPCCRVGDQWRKRHAGRQEDWSPRPTALVPTSLASRAVYLRLAAGDRFLPAACPAQ
jgi:hypothetical protein